MPASQATIQTGSPGRYLTQLCQHASKMGTSRLHRPRSHAGGGEPPQIRHAEWSETDGTVTLNWGQWTIHAAPGTLTLRAEAGSEEDLKRLRDLITARLEKIGRRDRLAGVAGAEDGEWSLYWTSRGRPVPTRLAPVLAGWADLDPRRTPRTSGRATRSSSTRVPARPAAGPVPWPVVPRR